MAKVRKLLRLTEKVEYLERENSMLRDRVAHLEKSFIKLSKRIQDHGIR